MISKNKGNIDRELIPFSQPIIGEEEIQEVVDTLKSGWLTSGRRVAAFERDFTQYKGRKAVAVNSCTAALHLSLLAAGIGPGDEVITSAMTFPATVNAIIHSGAQPILADIDPTTLNISPREIEKKITQRTKAILVVHFSGRMCAMAEILAIIDKKQKKQSLILIEDCAHAIESRQNGRESGTFGEYGCFSFYASKNLTMGEGGAVLVRDGDKEDIIRCLANHGRDQSSWQLQALPAKKRKTKNRLAYEIKEAGFKYNVTDIQAALGAIQLAKLEERYLRRQRIWQLYQENLTGLPLILPQKIEILPNRQQKKPKNRHALHLYTVQISKTQSKTIRDEIVNYLLKKKIIVSIHYRSIADFPFYQKKLAIQGEQLPNAQEFGETTFSLPLSAKLTDTQIMRVIEVVRRFFKKKNA